MNRIFLACILALSLSAETVVNFISPSSPTLDTYPTHKSIFGKGGQMTGLTNVAQLTNTGAGGVPTQRREAGMVAIVNGVAYQLGPDLATWTVVREIDITGFGAIGNGVYDSTAAIAAAVAIGKTLNVGIKIPAGEFLTSTSIDCQNTGDNNLEFPGIKGEGFSLSKITMTGSDQPILILRGRGGTYSDFKIQYQTQAALTHSNSIAVKMNGLVYYTRFQNLEVMNGYAGFKNVTVSGAQSAFNCTFDNVVVRNFYAGCFDVLSSSGNAYANVYCSNPALDAVDRVFRDSAGASVYGQLNLEHSNIREGPLLSIAGDANTIQMLHVEGIRFLTDSSIVSAGNTALDIASISLVNNYVAGQWLTSISHSGATATATVNNLTSAVSGGHGFRVGDLVSISGATDALYNGSHLVIGVTPTTFDYAMSGDPGADAVLNLVGGYDFLHAFLDSFAAISLFTTSQYDGGKVHVSTLQARNNKIVYNTGALRNLYGIFLGRSYGGKLLQTTYDFINTGSSAFRVGDQYLAQNNIIASWRYDTNAFVYTQLPHRLAEGDHVSMSGGIGLGFGTNYQQVMHVVDANTFGVVFTTNLSFGLVKETGALIPVKAYITNRARASNIATVTTSVAHQMSAGNTGIVRGMSDATYTSQNMIVLSVPSTTSFTYRSVGSDEAQTTESNGVVSQYSGGLNVNIQTPTTAAVIKAGLFSHNLVCLPATNLAPASITYITNTAGGLRMGDTVRLTSYSSPGNPNQKIWGYVDTNDSFVVAVGNQGPVTVTNAVTLLWADFTGNLGGTNLGETYTLNSWTNGLAPDIQIFTSSGFWTNPPGKTMAYVYVISGGGGGGSGRKGAAGTVRCGGGGGGAAGFSSALFPLSVLSGVETVNVGSGGAGGTAVSTNDTDGNSGSNGTASGFGTEVTSGVGVGGGGGTATAGTAGTGGAASFTGAAGAAASGTGAAGAQPTQASNTSGGGASGSGITSVDSTGIGGVGGTVAVSSIVAGGTAGTSVTNGGAGNNPAGSAGPVGGTGGGGGASSITTNATNGGAGAIGAGGGGGGAGLNSTGNSGAGGAGGGGLVVIICI